MVPENLFLREFRRLIYVRKENIILSLHLHFDFCKRTMRNGFPLMPALLLNSLNVNRIVIKMMVKTELVYIFAERTKGQDSFKMDPRFLPLLGLVDDGNVVEDISKLQPVK